MTFKAVNKYSFKLTSFVPIVSISILYLFYISSIVDLGHYPKPSIDDPKEIGMTVLYYVTWFGFFVVFCSSILWFVNLIIGIYHKSIPQKHLILFIIGSSIFLIQIIYDPGHVIYWFLD